MQTLRHSDPRGEITRQRILETAIEMFGAEGYDGASTRRLAARAGVNQPAIQYHFASKEGLYRAAIEHMAEALVNDMSGMSERVANALANDPSEEELYRLLFDLIDTFADMMLDETGHESRSQFIIRAEIENAAALDVLAQTIVASIIRPCAALVGRIVGPSASEEEILLRTLAILGQLLNFKNRCLGGAIRRVLGWNEFGQDRKDAVKAIVRAQTHAILAAAKEDRV